MKNENSKRDEDKKEVYTKPKVLATYQKEDLEEVIRPHGTPIVGGGCGCGSGCGG